MRIATVNLVCTIMLVAWHQTITAETDVPKELKYEAIETTNILSMFEIKTIKINGFILS